MSNVWGCDAYGRCLNSSKCLTCGTEQRLLKLPEDKNRKKAQNKAKGTRFNPFLPPEESWKQLESEVAAKLNAIPTLKEYDDAHRVVGSGNKPGLPGDVRDSVMLNECKERNTVTAKGAKYFTIPKEHLEKIMAEAKMLNLYPGYPFRYNGDPEIYIVQPFQTTVDMVHEIKVLRRERQKLEHEIRLLKEQKDG